jgi:type I pantothenate kinase
MLARFLTFSRDEWSQLLPSTPLRLTEADAEALRAADEHLSLSEVTEVYVALSRLLNLYITSARALHRSTSDFLGLESDAPVPYVIGVAGAVASGKSTTARVLQLLLARWPEHQRVEVVTTDGFLYPNATLEARGLVARKGFPESYDQGRLVRFLADIKAGRPEVAAPVYSHRTYDIVPGRFDVFRRPDVLIIEGLSILQMGTTTHVFVSDLLDYSIFVDASEADIRRWYVARFLALRKAAIDDADSFYSRFTSMSEEETAVVADMVWREVNGVNLKENVEPTRLRAQLILEKASDHSVRRIRLRKL